MSPSSSESPDGPQPPRQRPPVARAPKDSSELDLWDFDDNGESSAKPEATELPQATKPRPRSLTPEPRTGGLSAETTAKRPQPAPSKAPAQPYEQRRKPADDLGELDDLPGVENPAPAPVAAPVISKSPVPSADSPVPMEETPSEPEDESSGNVDPAPENEPEIPEPAFSAVPLDVQAIRRKLGLSKIEKIGLGALAAVLLVGGIILLSVARHRLPIHDSAADYPHYPVKGTIVTVRGAESFWREPIPGKDTVRRDSKLIPVVKLTLEGPPCAIRAFFRNENGETIGDPVTRAANGGPIEISATAGLEDIAFHASYRTGQAEPWKLELFEAPSTDSPRQDFKKLLETPISNDRH